MQESLAQLPIKKPIKSTEMQIDVHLVRKGMYVSELDVDWSQTRFMFKGFSVTSQAHIDELYRCCKWVIISKDLSTEESLVSLKATIEKPASLSAFGEPVVAMSSVQSSQYKFPVSADASEKTQEDSQSKAGAFNPFDSLYSLVDGVANEFNQIIASLSKPRLRKSSYKSNYDPNQLHHNKEQSIRDDFNKIVKAKAIRTQFKLDDSPDLVNHVAQATIKQEVTKAEIVRDELFTAVSATLDQDLMGSNIHESISIAKEAVTGVVESLSRNPEAIQLVGKIKRLDSHSYQHAIDVSLMMVAFGRELCLSNADLIDVGLGGLLHDVGEIKPPANVSQIQRIKNITKFKIYKDHVHEGLRILEADQQGERVQNSKIVRQIIENHHEFYDGTGYPKGRSRGQIGLYGNMIIIVDNYISMITGRSCDQPLTPSQAIRLMHQHKGTKFHQQMLEQFIQLIGMYPVGSHVQLNTGDVAVVMKQNKERKMKPVVMVFADKRGVKISKPVHIDLMTQTEGDRQLFITKEVAADQVEMRIEDYL